MPAPLSYEFVYKYIEEHNKCKLLTKKGNYKNAQTKLEIECKCGKIFTTDFMHFKRGRTIPKQQCDICSGYKPYNIKTVQEIANKSNCIFLDTKYKDKDTLYNFKCKCGKIFQKSLSNFLKGQTKCNFCVFGRETQKLSEEDMRTHIEKIGGKMIERNIDKKIKMQCKCGRTFYATYDKIIIRHKILCNKCSNSKSIAEIKSEQYLEDNKINFVSQYIFSDLKTEKNGYLRFDLAIFKENKLICLIELDGEQHYKIGFYSKTEEDLKWIQTRDEMKNNYCVKNNIHLYRIPYWNFNHINEELEKILKQENLVPSSQ